MGSNPFVFSGKYICNPHELHPNHAAHPSHVGPPPPAQRRLQTVQSCARKYAATSPASASPAAVAATAWAAVVADSVREVVAPLPEVTDLEVLEVLPRCCATRGPTVWDSAGICTSVPAALRSLTLRYLQPSLHDRPSAKPTNAHPGRLCSRGASARDAFEPAGFARPIGAGGCLAERRAAGLIDTVRLWVTAMRDDMSPRRE